MIRAAAVVGATLDPLVIGAGAKRKRFDPRMRRRGRRWRNGCSAVSGAATYEVANDLILGDGPVRHQDRDHRTRVAYPAGRRLADRAAGVAWPGRRGGGRLRRATRGLAAGRARDAMGRFYRGQRPRQHWPPLPSSRRRMADTEAVPARAVVCAGRATRRPIAHAARAGRHLPGAQKERGRSRRRLEMHALRRARGGHYAVPGLNRPAHSYYAAKTGGAGLAFDGIPGDRAEKPTMLSRLAGHRSQPAAPRRGA